MKKVKWLVPAFLTLALTTTPTLVSCGDDDDDPIENPNNPGGGGGIIIDDDMTIQEQKQQLEKTGKALMGKVQAADFKNVKDLAEYIHDTYKNYDGEAVEDWYDDCLESITESLGSSQDGNTTYRDYQVIWAASAFTGHFEAKNGKWVYTEADDLQFTVKDLDKNTCTLKLTATGKTKTVYLDTETDWDWYGGYYSGYFYEKETEKHYLVVPEKVVVTLTQAGNTLATLTVNADLSGMVGNEFDWRMGTYKVSSSFSVNGYSWVVERAHYNASSSAALVTKLVQNETTLCSMSATASGNANDKSLTDVNLYCDILGEVQIKGVCHDVIKLRDLLEDADEASYDEANFKSYINQANEQIDLGVYYFGGETEQANIKLEPFRGDYRKWDEEPVIYFQDGTSYSTFEAFFDEGSFKSLIDRFNSWIESFENL